MKLLTSLPLFLLFAGTAFAQQNIPCQYTSIKKVQYDSVVRIPFLVRNPQIQKQPGRLIIPLANQKFKVFDDINVDTDMGEYSYLGDVRNTRLSLIRKAALHNEMYFVVNQLNGKVDTLIGGPVFAPNLQDFACLNNPGMEEAQRIQLGTIRDGQLTIRGYIPEKKKTFITAIGYAINNALYAKDEDGKCWQLNVNTP
ncbi:hypothetical protein [Paraflavitalea sp. CAU 1676]|uniref:hypothetical protein n=1 Tax=Paraflavitalea sp. CAU 1676 TaxID=3032598 RepID=UPI0023DC9A0A|nr:hypothetical protein [Paraflavitalea sp. CAU 1676]MDF2189156.1 hypothetical protein [Paraflavitalea sp. CAU 1676]